MKMIQPSYEILTDIDSNKILKYIELAARTCYKSEDKITEDNSSAKQLIQKLLNRKHEAMIEFGHIMVKFICNRGFTHELVRHRVGCSYAQESTRYCNYTKDKFGSEITCIIPTWYHKEEVDNFSRIIWKKSMEKCEQHYFRLIELGLAPQDARGVLPIDVKTEIVMDANIREWRHIFKMRTVSGAHPSMQQLMIPLLKEFKEKIPILFDDIYLRY